LQTIVIFVFMTLCYVRLSLY